MKNQPSKNPEQEKINIAPELNLFLNHHLEEVFHRYQMVVELYEARDKSAKFGHRPSHFFGMLFPRPSLENLMFRAAIDFIFRHFGPSREQPAVPSLQVLEQRLSEETVFTVISPSEKLKAAEVQAETTPETTEGPKQVNQMVQKALRPELFPPASVVKKAHPRPDLRKTKAPADPEDDDTDASRFILENATEPDPLPEQKKKIK
jgi:hypothetical protein